MTGTEPGNDERALLEELAARAREEAGGGEPPAPEEILDYLAGRLPPEEEERMARRVAADPDLARTVLDLAELQAAVDGTEAGEPPAPDLASRAAWRELRGRLEEREAPATAARRLRPFLAAAAALLILLAAGLGYRVVSLERQLDRPLTNLASAELFTGDRGAGAVREVPVPAGERLLLTVEPAQRCAAYEAVLAGPGADERWSGPLVRDRRGQLTLLIRGAPGSYVLTLSGCEPPRRLQEHRFRIVRPDGAPAGTGAG